MAITQWVEGSATKPRPRLNLDVSHAHGAATAGAGCIAARRNAVQPDQPLPPSDPGSLSVKREIVINASTLEVRVALLEDGSLTEFYLERKQHRGLAGNIYKGKVTRVLPGMQAAFVDIGLEKAGFLHVSDFHDDVQALGSIAEVIGEEDVETDPVDGEVTAAMKRSRRGPARVGGAGRPGRAVRGNRSARRSARLPARRAGRAAKCAARCASRSAAKCATGCAARRAPAHATGRTPAGRTAKRREAQRKKT